MESTFFLSNWHAETERLRLKCSHFFSFFLRYYLCTFENIIIVNLLASEDYSEPLSSLRQVFNVNLISYFNRINYFYLNFYR